MKNTDKDLCNQGLVSPDEFKKELADFIEILRVRISDAAFDKNYITLKNELAALEKRIYKTGSTVGRPLSPVVGQQYFDTSLNIPVFFNGTTWVNANGQEV